MLFCYSKCKIWSTFDYFNFSNWRTSFSYTIYFVNVFLHWKCLFWNAYVSILPILFRENRILYYRELCVSGDTLSCAPFSYPLPSWGGEVGGGGSTWSSISWHRFNNISVERNQENAFKLLVCCGSCNVPSWTVFNTKSDQTRCLIVTAMLPRIS